MTTGTAASASGDPAPSETAAGDVVARVQRALAPHGLTLRGGFAFSHEDRPPPALSPAPARSVLLVGSVGGAYWPRFSAWRAQQREDEPDPLDRWSRLIIDSIARGVGARGVSPSDRPFLPFQSWAMRAEGLRPSPLGLLIHPVYGLWHAYRGALLFDARIPIQDVRDLNHPCVSCPGKPCRKACPVAAHARSEFAHSACFDHARAPPSPCRSGCLDRNACPVGAGHRIPAEAQAFHQAAFLR